MKDSIWQKAIVVLAAGASLLTLKAAPDPIPVSVPQPPPPPAAVSPAAAAAVQTVRTEPENVQTPAQAPTSDSVPAATPSSRSGSVDVMPDAAALQKLARRALLDATGRRMHVGPVELKEKLSDGSWRVLVTLEDGRQVSGRLYRNRKRYHIAVDRRELFAPEQTIQIIK